MKIKKIAAPDRIDDAYALLMSDPDCRIVAGNTYPEANPDDKPVLLLDLKNLDLNYIHSTTFTIQVGAATPLDAVEKSDLLNAFNNGIFHNSLKDVCDEDFRRIATVGGNLALKYAYSDLIPALLVTDPMILFYGYEKEALEDIHHEHLSYIPLEEYLQMEPLRDIMTEIVIPKTMNSNFVCRKDPESRRTLLNLAVARYGSQLRVAIGARPMVAKLWRGNDKTAAEEIINYFDFADDDLISAEERKILAKELFHEACRLIDFR